MKYHIIAFFLGFLLDLLFGDPHWLPHPIQLIGKLIAQTEKSIRNLCRKKTDKNKAELWQGIGLVSVVLITVMAVSISLLLFAYWLHPYMGTAVESIMTYQILAAKCLKVESMKVCQCLKNGDLEQARAAVSMIVGRDTECLDEKGVAKAAIETVAENTSDGVIAPMLYLAIGGPVLGFFYKTVNTMDSMVGYKNDTYLYFGRAAAKLDDVMNYIPARISAFLMILCSFLLGSSFSGKGAWSIYQRDRRKHPSPNSAQTEAVCAGALGIQLAGDARYFGKIVKKPYIGEALRSVEQEDITRANRLLYAAAWMCELLCLLLMVILSVGKGLV
ncbi:cobalamin biosynthesis protein CobD [Lachnospiraceae bacterium 3-1]|nr:cobalamin biosynthesis protein CobD [Lachnospiraceae bacterium 3-1]